MNKYIVNTIFLITTAFLLNGCSSGGSSNESQTYGDETFFPFDEENGAIAYNARFDIYNGVIVGASRTTGKVNNALYFGNNSPSYVSFSEGAGEEPEVVVSFPNGTISIEAWINFESLSPSEEYHFFGSAGSGIKNFRLFVVDGQLKFVVYSSGDEIDLIETDYVFGVDTWYHIAVTYSGSEAKFYIDGELNASSTITVPLDRIINPLYLGGANSYSSVNSFPGYIDELRFSAVLRSADEIKEYYDSTR